MSLQDFRNRHPDGSVVDIDNYPKGSVYQCVDLVKMFLKEEKGVPNDSYGDAKRYWESPNDQLRNAIKKAGGGWLETKDVRSGDITPLRPVDNKKAHEEGHIGLATGKQTNTHFEMLEQNGSTGNGKGQGNDRIRTRMMPKDRLYGVIRFVEPGATTPPQPASQSAGVGVRINGGKGQQWNVRRNPGMGDNIVPADGKNPNEVLPGQTYNAIIGDNGWAAIDFRGMRVYIGPKVYTKI